ncbi:hypothetical protein BJ508DRAFT_376706 [Ascobolus immersus RN42]|uniref:F-box domain-containing protein n=1 Tax=Ascobolus immersus RN42 TaxID=1160509 RepID=A0A3N4IA02_ASCIM|nr:hypothetical protein BJ508DRAFT_376706 [Ascobolus immersus RN42]
MLETLPFPLLVIALFAESRRILIFAYLSLFLHFLYTFIHSTIYPAPKPKPKPVPFRFTHLPFELRLSIYSNCTAFSLLQLSRSSYQLRYEILRNPKLYLNSDGYRPAPTGTTYPPSHQLRPLPVVQLWRLTLKQIDFISDPAERRLVETQLKRVVVVTPIGPGQSKFSDWMLCGKRGMEGCGRLRWKRDAEVGAAYRAMDCECGRVYGLRPISVDGALERRMSC